MGYVNKTALSTTLADLSAPAETATIPIFENTPAVKATGSYTIQANPSNNNTIVFNGVTFTFKTSPTLVTDVQIGTGATGSDTNLGKTIDNLKTVLNASTNPLISCATYTDNHTSSNKDGTQISVEFDNAGSLGNYYTLGTATANITRSDAKLASGADALQALKSINLSDLATAINGILNP